MTNIVHKLTNSDIQQLMSKIPFETSKLSRGMKAKTKYKGTSISIYNSNKVMFQGKDAERIAAQLLPNVTKSQPSNKKASQPNKRFHITNFNVLVVMRQEVAIISDH